LVGRAGCRRGPVVLGGVLRPTGWQAGGASARWGLGACRRVGEACLPADAAAACRLAGWLTVGHVIGANAIGHNPGNDACRQQTGGGGMCHLLPGGICRWGADGVQMVHHTTGAACVGD